MLAKGLLNQPGTVDSRPFGAPFVARSNSESNTTWMVSMLWIVDNQTNKSTDRHQRATLGNEEVLSSILSKL